MIDHFAQARRFDAFDQFIRTEGPFPCRTPDVDALRIKDEDIAINSFQGGTQRVETERVIGCDENGRLWSWLTKRVQPWLDAMSHAVDRPACEEVVPCIGKRQVAGSRHDLGRIKVY